MKNVYQCLFLFLLGISLSCTKATESQLSALDPTSSNPTINSAPTVSLGADKIFRLPINSAVLAATASDTDGTIANYSWSQISGPNNAIFENSNVSSKTFSGLIQGTYTLRVSVTDNRGAVATDELIMTVQALTQTDAYVSATDDWWLDPVTSFIPQIVGKKLDPNQVVTRNIWYIYPNEPVLGNSSTDTISVSNIETKNYVLKYVIQKVTSGDYFAQQFMTIFRAVEFTPTELASGLSIKNLRDLDMKNMVEYPTKLPPVNHPRLLGTNSDLFQEVTVLDQMPCSSQPIEGLGAIPNFRDKWDSASFGYYKCKGQNLTTFATNPQTLEYFKPTPVFNQKRDYRILFIIRRLQNCFATTPTACGYTQTDFSDFKNRFIAAQMAEFNQNWITDPNNMLVYSNWNYGHFPYDIYSGEPYRYWTTYLDTLWSDLTQTQKNFLKIQMSYRIDAWLENVRKKDWGYSNGNNWNGSQAEGLVAWALTFYYEEPVRAKAVLQSVIDGLWLHRDYYMNTGYYKEGASYIAVSYLPLMRAHRMLVAAFGTQLRSMKWDYFPKLSEFFKQSIGSDGLAFGFGDAYTRNGNAHLIPLTAMLIKEVIKQSPIGSIPLNSCDVRDAFKNIYYASFLDDPWGFEPAYARDWVQIVSTCNDASAQTGTSKVLYDSLGQEGLIKTFMPGSTVMGALPASLRWKYADETSVGFSGTPNTFAHREMDFGALVWGAYGSRLIDDWGYGNIVDRNVMYSVIKNLDFLPQGSNTLSVPDAFDKNADGSIIPDTNRSQLFGQSGQVFIETISNVEHVRMDGSIVYGSNHVDGVMEYFDRYIIPFGDGNYVIADSFKLKGAMTSRVQENFYASYMTNRDATEPADCQNLSLHKDLALISPKVISIKPRCSQVGSKRMSEVEGSITFDSLSDGAFQLNAAPQQLPGRTGLDDARSRYFIYQPNVAVNSDIRLFSLAASPKSQTHVPAVISHAACQTGKFCFAVQMKGVTKNYRFSIIGGRYKLESIY
ncbi:MAG: hypothetical protein H7Z71_05410 [Moraxellaceae bacterium]|nr:hypothetical protein [Pseudobdellovibrionaceae bacterium]